MELHKKFFGVVHCDTLDWGRCAVWLILQAFERENREYLQHLKSHYGNKKIQLARMPSNNVALPVIYLTGAVLDIELMNFRCYKEQPLNLQPWV
jgi:hypothetical protein